MPSEHDDSQNQSITGTDPEIMVLVIIVAVFSFKRIPTFSLVESGGESSATVPPSSQEVQDATSLQVIPLPVPAFLVPDMIVPFLHPPPILQQDKGKKFAERTVEAPGQKRKAPEAGEGILKDTRKSRWIEEGCRTSLNPTKGTADSNLFTRQGQGDNLTMGSKTSFWDVLADHVEALIKA
ncbi:hypothetical protein Fot_24424 [Forsythia ovata]|uniref:Uncharacterized protein n=1 Tax=Forsythia ovata TaxID=205694 RepID=A0ABD1U660_9LAMI